MARWSHLKLKQEKVETMGKQRMLGSRKRRLEWILEKNTKKETEKLSM